jgi:hypothetical protein
VAELTEAQRIALFKEGDGLLRGTLAFKSGCSLAEDDHRPDNQQAIDLYYETRARLWETLGHLDTHELTHFKAYVRRCAANAWVDHLRERHPMRLSLRNRMLYFVKTHPERFVIDRDDDETLTCGARRTRDPVGAHRSGHIAQPAWRARGLGAATIDPAAGRRVVPAARWPCRGLRRRPRDRSADIGADGSAGCAGRGHRVADRSAGRTGWTSPTS